MKKQEKIDHIPELELQVKPVQVPVLKISRLINSIYYFIEQELIYLICKGKSNKEIGDTLYISLQTVKHHIHSIYRKLNIKNRVQLSNFFHNISRGTMGQNPPPKIR